jgi:hypothetical protein
MPSFPDYHESVTSELEAVKNRIRVLVTHWQTDGEWKEAALRLFCAEPQFHPAFRRFSMMICQYFTRRLCVFTIQQAM